MESPVQLIEFPADDPERARNFWSRLLGIQLEQRSEGQGEGWQTNNGRTEFGLHSRGMGPGDTVSLPYFKVADLEQALARVPALGGSIIHPGSKWAICRDSEGSPFGLTSDR